MKRIIFFMGIMISGLHLLAQDQSRDQDRIKERDHLTFRDGAVYQVREVDPDGTVRKRDRKRKQLKNGECISMNGKRYQNHQRFLERFNGHSQVKNQQQYRSIERDQSRAQQRRSRQH
jgi:hypothetical protein